MKRFLCVVGMLCTMALVRCEPPEEMKKIFQECAKEAGLPEHDGPPNGPSNFDDPKVKCLHTCIMKKKGGLVDGKVSVEKAIEMAAKHLPGGATDAVKADINECATKANEEKDECGVGGAFYKCTMEKHPKKH